MSRYRHARALSLPPRAADTGMVSLATLCRAEITSAAHSAALSSATSSETAFAGRAPCPRRLRCLVVLMPRWRSGVLSMSSPPDDFGSGAVQQRVVFDAAHFDTVVASSLASRASKIADRTFLCSYRFQSRGFSLASASCAAVARASGPAMRRRQHLMNPLLPTGTNPRFARSIGSSDVVFRYRTESESQAALIFLQPASSLFHVCTVS